MHCVLPELGPQAVTAGGAVTTEFPEASCAEFPEASCTGLSFDIVKGTAGEGGGQHGVVRAALAAGTGPGTATGPGVK